MICRDKQQNHPNDQKTYRIPSIQTRLIKNSIKHKV